MQLEDGLTIEAASHLAWIDGIEELAVSVGGASGLDADGAYFFGVALREALINAIQHGHAFEARRRVRIEIRVASGRVMVATVQDSGPGFDPGRVRDPLAAENLTKPDGRGLLFMRRFTDRVHFSFPRSGGAVVRLEKDLPARAA